MLKGIFRNLAVPSSEPAEVATMAMTAARSLGAFGDARIVPPHSTRTPADPKTVKIGFFGNIANNFYNITKGLRHMGFDAELVLQDGGIDSFPMAQPYWEEVPLECETTEAVGFDPGDWPLPNFVHRTAWDRDLQARYYGRWSAIGEVQTLYRGHFGRDITPDQALLLAQNMGHWDYLPRMKAYDVVLLSSAAIALGPFVPCPFAVFPSGGDMTLAPFDESTLEGPLIRAGFRRCGKVLLGSPYWRDYLARMDVLEKDVRTTLLLDTDVCAPGEEPGLRDAWHAKVGGSVFVHSTCRQDWRWKGNDKLMRAFAELDHPEMRLVLTRWGDDVDRSNGLIDELGIGGKVLWLPLGSKPVVRQRQRAADIIVDQLVMASFGTSVIEALAAARPVIMNLEPPHQELGDYKLPPVISAKSEGEVQGALERLADPAAREAAGREGRAWAVANRGFEARAEPLAREIAELVS